MDSDVMPPSNEAGRSRSARHYLTETALSDRLQPTLVLAARVLGFPHAQVNIIDLDTQHTLQGSGIFRP